MRGVYLPSFFFYNCFVGFLFSLGFVMFYVNPSFDWYEATIHFGEISSFDDQVFEGEFDDVMLNLKECFPDFSFVQCTAKNGWKYAYNFVCGSDVLCNISFINSASFKKCCHLIFTGFHSRSGSDFLRAYYPEHSVTRVDCACDTFFESPIQSVTIPEMFLDCKEIAKSYRVSSSVAGDWLSGDKGRTLYLGSKKSAVQMRIYEKGKQPELLHLNMPTWVRFEMQYRPDKSVRADVSSRSPSELLGGFAWVKEIIDKYYNVVNGEKLTVVVDRHAVDCDRALKHMFFQYRKQLQKKALDFNSVTGFTDYLLSCIYPDNVVSANEAHCSDLLPIDFYFEDCDYE